MGRVWLSVLLPLLSCLAFPQRNEGGYEYQNEEFMKYPIQRNAYRNPPWQSLNYEDGYVPYIEGSPIFIPRVHSSQEYRDIVPEVSFQNLKSGDAYERPSTGEHYEQTRHNLLGYAYPKNYIQSKGAYENGNKVYVGSNNYPELSSQKDIANKVNSENEEIDGRFVVGVVKDARDSEQATVKSSVHEFPDYESPIVHSVVGISPESESFEDYEHPQVIGARVASEAAGKSNYELASIKEEKNSYGNEASIVSGSFRELNDDHENPAIIGSVKLYPDADSEQPVIVGSVAKETEGHEKTVVTSVVDDDKYENPEILGSVVKRNIHDYETPIVVGSVLGHKVVDEDGMPTVLEVVYKNRVSGVTDSEKNSKYPNVNKLVLHETGFSVKENLKSAGGSTPSRYTQTVKNSLKTREDYQNSVDVKDMSYKDYNSDNYYETNAAEAQSETESIDLNMLESTLLNIDESEQLVDLGSGFVNGNLSLSFLPLSAYVESLMTNIQAREKSLYKPCFTRKNETGNCMPLQMCTIFSNLDDLLSNICVIDEVFVGICCPEFPVKRIEVDWGSESFSSDLSSSQNAANAPEDCGKLASNVRTAGSWPWVAPLMKTSTGEIFCGSTLINNRYVLTAAHCTTRIPLNRIMVRLSELDSRKMSAESFSVIEIKRHAQYDPRTMQNDIALLKLAKSVPFGDFRKPVCLPKSESDYIGEMGTLLGWKGVFGNGRLVESLDIISKEECQSRIGIGISDFVLCTSPRSEETTCNVDSGAPLVTGHNARYEVIGLLTWNRNDCDSRYPSIFTKVSSYKEWIENLAN